MPIARLKQNELEVHRAKKLAALATAVSSTSKARTHEVDGSRVVKLNAIRQQLVTATTIPATTPKFYPADSEPNFVRKVNALMAAAGV